MADDKTPKKAREVLKVDSLPEGVKMVDPNSTPNPITTTKADLKPIVVNPAGEATVPKDLDPDATKRLISDVQSEQRSERSDEVAFPKQESNIVPLSELELKAERERQNRIAVVGNKPGPFTFQAPTLPQTGTRSNAYADEDNLEDLSRRLASGFGLPGHLPGTGLGGQARLDVARDLAHRDWKESRKTGSTVNGIRPDDLEPTRESVSGGWHERLANVMHVTNLPENDLRGHASYLQMPFGDYVDAMHTVAAHHWNFFGKGAKDKQGNPIRNTFTHRDVNPLTDYWIHPKTGQRLKISETLDHPDLPKDENGKLSFTRTKNKFAGVARDLETMAMGPTEAQHFGWNSKKEADGSKTYYHTMGGLTPSGARVTPLLNHVVKEARDVAQGHLGTASRSQHVEIAGDLVESLAPGSLGARKAGWWRGKVETVPVLKRPHTAIVSTTNETGTDLVKAGAADEDNTVGFTSDDTAEDRAKKDLLMPGSSKDPGVGRQFSGAYIGAGPVRGVGVDQSAVEQIKEARRTSASGLIGARAAGVDLSTGDTPEEIAKGAKSVYLGTGDAARTRLAEGLAIISGKKDLSPGEAFMGLETKMRKATVSRKNRAKPGESDTEELTLPVEIPQPEVKAKRRKRENPLGTPPKPKIYTTRTGTGIERRAGSSAVMVTQGTPQPLKTEVSTEEKFAAATAPRVSQQLRFYFDNPSEGVRGVDSQLDRAEAESKSTQFPRPQPMHPVVSGIRGQEGPVTPEAIKSAQFSDLILSQPQLPEPGEEPKKKRTRKPKKAEQLDLFDFKDPDNPTPEELTASSERKNAEKLKERFGPGRLVKPKADTVRVSRRRI